MCEKETHKSLQGHIGLKTKWVSVSREGVYPNLPQAKIRDATALQNRWILGETQNSPWPSPLAPFSYILEGRGLLMKTHTDGTISGWCHWMVETTMHHHYDQFHHNSLLICRQRILSGKDTLTWSLPSILMTKALPFLMKELILSGLTFEGLRRV